MNYTNFTGIKTLQMNTQYYVEDICKPYVESLSKAYFNIAIFNVCFSVVYPILNKFRDKLIFSINTENIKYDIEIQDIIDILMVVFTILNVFGFGYWIILNTDIKWFINLPVIRWFW